MKTKLLTISLLLGVLTACSDGGLTTTSANDLMQPDFNYEIDTRGTNSEIYEFTPKSNKKKTCVFVTLYNGEAMGLQCFDK